MATGEAQPQMHPWVTDSQTLFTASRCLRLYFLHRDFFKMLAGCFHRCWFYKSVFSVANQKLPLEES